MIRPRNITEERCSKEKEFSIITLVSDKHIYGNMVRSFENSGFDSTNSEFLFIDNTCTNQGDGFSGLNHALSIAKGQYLLLAHQDILLEFDDIEVLRNAISEIDILDSNWAVLGNGGGNHHLDQKFIRITDPSGENQMIGKFPARVQALDENFLIIKATTNLGFSNDLTGFHFYGLDLCQQARYRGFSCYVISFHLRHLSSGRKNTEFYKLKGAFIKNHQRKTASRFIRLTTGRICLSGSNFFCKLYNNPKVLFCLRKTGMYKILAKQ